jgi:hypothetical protein
MIATARIAATTANEMMICQLSSVTPRYRHCETQSAALTSKQPIRMTAVITLVSSSLPNSGRISHFLLKAFDPLSRS